MTYPDYIRNKALELREKQKLTIDELAECLSISRTTIYCWVKDVEIPRKPGRGFATHGQKMGTEAMQAKYRAIREDAYADGWSRYAALLEKPTFRDFICMYIGEGTKTKRNEVAICNSDPAVVLLGYRWIRYFTRNRIGFGLQFHADQSLDELRAFWSSNLGIESDRIKFQRKSNSGQLSGRRWRSRHGVLAVRTGDTRFRAQLEAWMDRLKLEWQ